MSEGKPRVEILDRWWSNVFRNVRERKEIGDKVKARGGFGKRKWMMEVYWRILSEWERTQIDRTEL